MFGLSSKETEEYKYYPTLVCNAKKEITKMSKNYHTTNEDVYQAVSNGIAGVENQTGTMETRELEDGSVELVGYGWMRYAVFDDGELTVFDEWYDRIKEQDKQAETTPRHIREVSAYADNFESRTPQVAATPDSVAQIGHYGGYEGL